MDQLSGFRQDYQKGELNRSDLPEHPISLFKTWMQHAIDEAVLEPNAMILSTSENQKPHSRVVLLKGLNEQGFVFFTNYHSAKGNELNANPNASLLFFWPQLQRQIRIEGHVSKTTSEESDHYFYSRPKGSQAGAIASPQSSVIESRDELDEAARIAESKELKRPEYWGGYVVTPHNIEFWQGRSNRLHDRFRYRKENTAWIVERLAP